MGFYFNFTAVLVSTMVPAVVIGLASGALSRRWPAARLLGASLIAAFLLWVAFELLWPWNHLGESRLYRWRIVAAIAGSAALGISLLVLVSRGRRPRPAI
jgi:hypothetical protein